jgi:L-malate glycosyltransferase
MKICLFSENHFKGGIDTFLISLINAWPDNGDEITIMCNAGHPGISTLNKKIYRSFRIRKYRRLYTSKLAHESDLLRIGKFSIVRAVFVISYHFLQYLCLFPWYVLSLSIQFRLSDFDRLMVVNGGYPASLLCRAAIVAWRIAGKPKLGVFNFHNSVPTPENKLGKFENLIDRLVSKNSEHIVTVSKDCLESLNVRPNLFSHPNRSYILNGIGDPRDNDGPNNLGKENDEGIEPYLLMLSTYEPRKGHLFLLRSFQIVHRQYPNLQLRTYGYGERDHKRKILEEISRLGMNSVVSLHDFTSETDSLIRNASILVVPSQEYESFNLTIIEGMAFGIPIVATDVGGMPQVLEGSGAGFVCPRSDPNEFAAAICKILDSRELATTMGECGRVTYEQRYSARTMACKYRELLA